MEFLTRFGIFKMLASTGFVVFALSLGAINTLYGRLILAALVLGWVGDFLLLSKRQAFFLGGLVSFLLGHLVFVAAFYSKGIQPVWALVVLGLATVTAYPVFHWLRPHLPSKMRIPVYAYMLVISLMLPLAAGAAGASGNMIILLGAVVFYLSDLSVARDRFVSPGAINQLWGLPLYYAAQFLLASTVRP